MRPNDFVPERWYSNPELILDRGGFAPFSLGKSQLPTTAPSKQAARKNLQSAAATLLFWRPVGASYPERLSLTSNLSLSFLGLPASYFYELATDLDSD